MRHAVEKPTIEGASRYADKFMQLAEAIGRIIDDVDSLYLGGWQAVQDEKAAVAELEEHGPNIIHALRTIAMRLDRTALSRITADEAGA